MTPEEQIEEIFGLSPTPRQTARFYDLIETKSREEALPYSAHFLQMVFQRVDRDSVAGRALARGLGFSTAFSLERAAADFGVSRQYLHRLQGEIEMRLGPLNARAAAKTESCLGASPENAGPSDQLS